MKAKNAERLRPLGLAGALKSFEGTALIPLIQTSLAEAGIDPLGYDLRRYGHDEYLGFPATSPYDQGNKLNPSPIVTALNEAAIAGRVTVDRAAYGTVRLPSWRVHLEDGSDPHEGNAWRTAKLSEVSLLEFKDASTGEVLCYAARLGSDGGRVGHALLSTNDVITGHVPH